MRRGTEDGRREGEKEDEDEEDDGVEQRSWITGYLMGGEMVGGGG